MSVSAYEKLSKKNIAPAKCILNLNWNKGTHWVGVKDMGGFVKYYDPFGVDSPLKINKPIIYNPVRDQEMNESNCGWRSLFWILKD